MIGRLGGKSEGGGGGGGVMSEKEGGNEAVCGWVGGEEGLHQYKQTNEKQQITILDQVAGTAGAGEDK